MLASEAEFGPAQSCFWHQVSLTYCKVRGVLEYCHGSLSDTRGSGISDAVLKHSVRQYITTRAPSDWNRSVDCGAVCDRMGSASAPPKTPLNSLTLSFAHFLTIVRTSSSSRTCDRPTLCGWCFTLLPYTMASLNSSTMVLWMALQKSSTVHAVFLNTTGAV
jgi:hypothetical protein